MSFIFIEEAFKILMCFTSSLDEGGERDWTLVFFSDKTKTVFQQIHRVAYQCCQAELEYEGHTDAEMEKNPPPHTQG